MSVNVPTKVTATAIRQSCTRKTATGMQKRFFPTLDLPSFQQARSVAVLALAPRNNDVLIGSRCLSCNRPLGGYMPESTPKASEEWYTGAGRLGGPRDRVIAPNPKTSAAMSAGGTAGTQRPSNSGDVSRGAGVQRNLVTTPAELLPPPSFDGVGSPEPTTHAPKRGPQGPLLFERRGTDGTEAATKSTPGLKGRILRSGGGGGGSVGAEGNVSVSKVCRTPNHARKVRATLCVSLRHGHALRCLVADMVREV